MPGGEDIERGRREESKNGANIRNTTQTTPSSYVIEDMESQWTSWLVPMFVVANVVVFIIAMYVNNCPKHEHSLFGGKCVAGFLGRFSFEPLRENPLFGPSSYT